MNNLENAEPRQYKTVLVEMPRSSIFQAYPLGYATEPWKHPSSTLWRVYINTTQPSRSHRTPCRL